MAYTADINIVVKGQAAVNALQKSLIEVGNKIDELAKKRVGPSPTLETFNKQLAEAKSRLNEVAAGTSSETAAIKNYVTALGNANAATERQNKLIQNEIDLREAATKNVKEFADIQAYLYEKQRQLENSKLDEKAARVQEQLDKQAAAAAESAAQIEKLNQRQAEFTARTDEAARAAARQTAEFIRQQRIAKEVVKVNANAPAPQLLLAPAAPGAPAMGGGARARITGPVERLGGARTQDQADMALRFAQALQQQVRPLSQIQYLYAGIASQAAKLQTIKALPDTAMLNASARGLQTIESIEDKRIARLERVRQKLQQIAAYEASSGTMANAGFGVQGPAVPPGGVPRKPGGRAPAPAGLGFRAQPGGENLALGAGFPLLFGGGAGQVAGGLIGSFFGEGFGGQILGSAIGQQLEDATRRITEIGTALKELNMDNLRDSVIQVNADLDTTVRQLVAAGQADAARAEVAKQVTLQTGMLPEVVSDITNNTNLLGNTWNEFTGAVSGTLSILSAPFVTALTVIGQGLAKAFQFVNLILGSVGLILKRAVELIAKIPFLQPILKFIEERTKAIAETEEQRLESARQITDQLSKELAANMQLQALESRRTLGRTTAEKAINAELDSQLQKNRINQEYASKAVELRKQLAATTDPRAQAELELALKQNEALRQQALTQQEIKDKLYAQGLEIEANTLKYDLAAEKINAQIAALDRGNEITQSRYSAEAALNDLYGVQLQRQYELAETAQQRMDIAIQMFTQQIKAAEIEYEQALNNNALLVKKAELEARLVELKYKQLEAEKAIAIAQAKSRGNTPEDIRDIANAYDKGLGFQQEAVQAAYDQVAATQEIAANQNIVADAIYKSNVIQAESALAQKLVSDEIGLSADEANKLAGELGAGAYTANQLASEMTNVAAQAAYAAQQIQNAINLQNMLNGGGNMNAGSTQAFAAGGYVTGPTQATVGEGGEPEYIIPASKMSEAMGRYAAGARGSSVIPDAATSDASGYSAGTSSINPVVNVTTGPVMNMNNSNYVSQADFLAGLQAASRQGAQMALATLQNNSSTRRAVGIR